MLVGGGTGGASRTRHVIDTHVINSYYTWLGGQTGGAKGETERLFLLNTAAHLRIKPIYTSYISGSLL